MARAKEFDEKTVLDKAVTLFWHKGYNGTSAQDLVEGLGISRSSMYDTFGDKRTLFIKALKLYEEKNTRDLISMADQSADPRETIRQILENLVKEDLNDQLAKGCFMVNTAIELAPHDKEVADIVNSNMADVVDAFYRTICKGQESGQLSPEIDAKAIARFLYNNVTGIRVSSRSGKDKKAMDDIIKVILSVLQ